jgi:cytidyltransferase-like protein
MKAMDKELATKDLLDVKRAFDKHNIPLVLIYGTCLGAYRDGDFLPDDHDIDLGVVEPITYRQRKEISWLLDDLGFISQDNMIFNVYGKFEKPDYGYNGDEKTGLLYLKRNVPLSILFFQKRGSEMLCRPKIKALPIMMSPSRFYEDMKELKFKGQKFLIPTPVEEYLAFTYFNNWKDKTDRRGALIFTEMYPDRIEEEMNIDERKVYVYMTGDILHTGHLEHLGNAKKYGRVVVGVLTDKAVMEKKPEPILSFKERIAIVGALKDVDEVMPQETYSPLDNVKKVKPDVLMETTDHAEMPANDYVKSYGGKVVITKVPKERQSSSLIKKKINEKKIFN